MDGNEEDLVRTPLSSVTADNQLEFRVFQQDLRERVEEMTRTRLDTVTKLAGLALAAFASIAGVAVFWFLNSIVAGAIAEDTEFDLRLQNRIDTAVDTLVADVQSQVESELERTNDALVSARILPLVASEATAFASDNRSFYQVESAEAVLEGLGLVAQDVSQLSPFERELVYRRVNAVMRAFWHAGDYHRVQRVYDIFGADLLGHREALITLTESALSSVIVAGMRQSHEGLIDELLGIPLDPNSVEIEYQQLLHIVFENDPEWTSERLLAALRQEEGRQPGFSSFAFQVVQQLAGEISPETEARAQGINYSPEAIERHREFMTAIALSMSAAE